MFKKKKNKIIKLVLSSSSGIIIFSLIIIIPILMLLDFFGANVTDGYVEGNSEYASDYRNVLNKYIKDGKGYVSLDRILYFYLEDDSLSFDEIYKDNLDEDLKQLKPISEVCELDKYKNYAVCDFYDMENSGQINEMQNKPFSSPLDFNNLTSTSIFMEERVVYGEYNVHGAWDFSSSNETPVYSVCDGTVKTVSFSYKTNSIDTSGGAGNYITLLCETDDITYEVLYGHLYPNSAKVKVGDSVSMWQQIAGVGTTGYSTGPHLHFQVSVNGSKVDGLSLIDFTNENSGYPQNIQFETKYGL